MEILRPDSEYLKLLERKRAVDKELKEIWKIYSDENEELPVIVAMRLRNLYNEYCELTDVL